MTRLFALFFLMASLASTGTSQAGSASAAKLDAAALLQEVKEKYDKAKYYNIEAIEEVEFRGDLSRQWDKSFFSAVMTSGKRYRFEGRNSMGWMTKISDGRSEWILDHAANMYKKKAAPEEDPSKFEGPIFMNQMSLNTAQRLLTDITVTLAALLHPVLLEDETLMFGSKQVRCYVVSSPGRYRGGSRDATRQLTFWIDKETHTIRKVHQHAEGALMMNDPYHHEVEDETTLYPVADLDVVSLPEMDFQFQPPEGARLVDKFPDFGNMSNAALIGSVAPDVNLQSADGKLVALSKFRGKPALLEFWATWCAPCVAAMPKLEKLFQEVSPKGLALISIDEDQDAKTATDFLAKHAEPWPNFHDPTGEIQQQFPQGGLPEIVLIDSSGTITYASIGFDESALRGAIVQLGPEFASLAAKPAP